MPTWLIVVGAVVVFYVVLFLWARYEVRRAPLVDDDHPWADDGV